MDKQRSFFDEEIARDDQVKRLHRRNDPVTSREAAAKVDVSKAEQQVLALFQQRRLDKLGLTGGEVNRLLDSPHRHKRLSGMREKGLILLGGVRKCRATGSKQQWYKLK